MSPGPARGPHWRRSGIASLAQAVDKRDKFTSGHSLRVKEIAVDIGREMRVGERELEALEWGGLLHDVGKIGVPDNVLLKQDRLTRDERMVMNAHPVLGDEIIAPVAKLAAERPIIRHHHEWYNGSGYPDRLIGDEIPKLARILHVADAFEAMTAQRPYRMTPLTPGLMVPGFSSWPCQSPSSRGTSLSRAAASVVVVDTCQRSVHAP